MQILAARYGNLICVAALNSQKKMALEFQHFKQPPQWFA